MSSPHVSIGDALIDASAKIRSRTRSLIALCIGVALSTLVLSDSNMLAAQDGAVLVDEFIYESAPFPQCHASTIEETPSGLVAAWFGGTEERNPDVEIWVSLHREGQWSDPVSVADGVQEDGTRHPCWNPVLLWYQNRLLLFYKVGPSPSEWWGMLKVSLDAGKTFSPATRLPDGILGPIKNKPIVLTNGRIVSGSSSEHDGWRLHVEWSDDGGATWKQTGPLNEKDELESIQPALLQLPDGRLQMVCRSRSSGHITTAYSDDQGETWSQLSELSLPNPNSGIDAVTLSGGSHALVYNHTARGRSPLNLVLSNNGQDWQAGLILAQEQRAEFSYPAIIQTNDGMLHITYTWKRQKIRHVVVDPNQLELLPIEDGQWPQR